MAPWSLPPKIKIYEALGCVGDKRIEISGNEGKVYSSSGKKFYVVKYDPTNNAIMANDNPSYWKGYLGYPSIAFLMIKGVLNCNSSYASALKGIPWKDINQLYSNDFAKTEEHVQEILRKRGVNITDFDNEVENIYAAIFELNIDKLGKKILPPEGY